MPQRQFWTNQVPCRIMFQLHEDPTKAASAPTMTMTVYDQAGNPMVRAAAAVPPGFAEFVVPDVVKDVMEAYSASTPEAARAAFLSATTAWRRAAEDSAQTR